MPATFLISDTHFGHRNICKFLRADGTKLRPWDNPDEMDEILVDNWNKTVRPKDKVYHLGDVVINRRCLQTLSRLNGDKVLIKGNHDIFKIHEYLEYFRDIRGSHVMDNMLLTHIPVHPSSKGRFKANLHGHTHSNVVTDHENNPDPWYIPLSVEHINYTPISFEEIRKQVNGLVA